ncbi:MAG TPA: NYN domain-containing protein [Chloroflexota bacterium]|nr:NYN domain-containing protein [Chloroflexota bacterium]
MSYSADERPDSGDQYSAESGASSGDTEETRAARPRRRRGRRTTPTERLEAGADEADAVIEATAEDENSVIDVEPDLLAAQQVENIGVAEMPTAPVNGNGGRGNGPDQELPRHQPAATSRTPTVSGQGAGQPRPRQAGFVQGQTARPAQGGQRQGQRSGRAPSLPPGVPSAAALDEIEPIRSGAATRAEPQGDLALLLHGFEEIQQRNTDRILAALRQAGGSDGAAPRTANTAERVGVFVDVPNLVYAARYLNRWVDFGRMLERLLGGRRLIRAHAYSPTDPDPSADQQFLTPVKSQGYRLTTKNYRTFASGAKKADMDLDLCMDVVRLVVAKAVECIVLCSGDGDFLPLLDFCADNGVRVEVASFVEATSDELRQACDRFYNLSAMEGIRLSRPLGATN